MECLKKYYPSAEQLSRVVTTVYCTEESCSSIFTSESNLNLHLLKTHKKSHLMQKSDNNLKNAYYCPELSCIYNNSLYFKNLKLLKQHYLKVHSARSFLCEKCNTGFSTLAAKKSHSDYCGVAFKCCDCDVLYPCYESLKTHGRRKKHTILDKINFKEKSADVVDDKLKGSKSDTCILKKEITLLPKSLSSSYMLIIPVKLSDEFQTTDKSSQTECSYPKLKTKRTQVTRDATGKRNSQQTQTCTKGRQQICVETQTVGDYRRNSTKLNKSVSNDNLLRKSIKTQTTLVTSLSKSCNTYFNIDDFSYITQIDVQRSSSGTQTCLVPAELIYSTSMTSTHDSIPTDTSDLNMEFINSKAGINDNMNMFDSSNFFNCNSETQTDLFGDDLFSYCDFYTNICTQTCEDILLNSLAFNDIQTQTVLDDVLRSVESQTIMSHCKKNLLTCHDMAHMETQTDNEFKQMLEEINA